MVIKTIQMGYTCDDIKKEFDIISYNTSKMIKNMND